MSRIIVVGSLNMDLVVRTPRFPQPGETIAGEDLAVVPGGKGANQAVAAARLGGRVAMVGRVGADAFGPRLLRSLEQQGVDTCHVCRDERSASGTAVILIDAQGENSIILSPGANQRVEPADVEAAQHLFQTAEMLVLQLEIPLETVELAAGLAKEQGLRVILNPAPGQVLPEGLLDHVDILVPNETELQLIAGREIAGVPARVGAAGELLGRGVSTVVVTLGADGALVVTPDEARLIPGRQADVVDTTAAGDAFVGALAVALTAGRTLYEAVEYANCAGALAVTKFGAQPSLPTAAEVDALFGRTGHGEGSPPL